MSENIMATMSKNNKVAQQVLAGGDAQSIKMLNNYRAKQGLTPIGQKRGEGAASSGVAGSNSPSAYARGKSARGQMTRMK